MSLPCGSGFDLYESNGIFCTSFGKLRGWVKSIIPNGIYPNTSKRLPAHAKVLIPDT